jgi:hypothetical protein
MATWVRFLLQNECRWLTLSSWGQAPRRVPDSIHSFYLASDPATAIVTTC